MADACRQWARECLNNGAMIIVPAVADYEVRRELIRAKKLYGVNRLDVFNLTASHRYLPITDVALKLAAELWAQARQKGTPTADARELDCDVVIAAQALTMNIPKTEIVIATTNIGHLAHFVNAELWQNIKP